MDESRCKKAVYSRGLSQCRRKAWKDGFCKQHHPDSIKARSIKNELAYREKQKLTPWYRLKVATERIAELELEVKELKKPSVTSDCEDLIPKSDPRKKGE